MTSMCERKPGKRRRVCNASSISHPHLFSLSLPVVARWTNESSIKAPHDELREQELLLSS